MLPLYTLALVYIQYCYRRRMVAIPSSTSRSFAVFIFGRSPSPMYNMQYCASISLGLRHFSSWVPVSSFAPPH